MPRPGPRPYECVRKAWHSERHQPIRGSLIQEIFRVVNEVHSSSTKKNKEWQEKLPVVALKAEEIMYSKANSEAEYMDLETLLERTNDAINTIIRLDESAETGELLQPCIEAALTLGCTPRRASRSQRNNSPQRYLRANSQEQTGDPHAIMEKSSPGNQTITSDPVLLYLNHSRFEPINSAKPNYTSFNRTLNQASPTQAHTASKSYSVYPLYYHGSRPQTERNLSHFGAVCSQSNTVGNFQSYPVENLDASAIFKPPPEIGCDLSLRLGPHLADGIGAKRSQPREIVDVGRDSAREVNIFCDQRRGRDCKLPFLRWENADHPSTMFLTKRSFQLEQSKVDQPVRKKSALCGYYVEDHQCCWQPKHPPPKHKDETLRSSGL
ncbi:uncharacterized protein LOC115753715 isoform X1 [Rhodamnia argentea]|uniref:Uncharacterized protein LOC115753715 isoform X1 n=2 Tax=Rhodamnia argentea TaxID=178133 RepID=A0A8B8QMB8_9MYRT|nr:uncharacterized protein LOC115753715 isoform X1 [Rhodamnia argentea]